MPFPIKILLTALIALASLACSVATTPALRQPKAGARPRSMPTDAALPFGNPSNASTDDADDHLLIRSSFALSYNNSRGTLNWIAWRTTAADLGERRERLPFEPDLDLPNGFRRVTSSDYSASGYDRGHMVPAADRFADEQLMRETFLMTNIVPQTPALNQYPWNKLESYARGIVRRGNDVYTIAGVYGDQGRLRNAVTVPTNCWKVIVVLPRGGTAVDERTRVIAVDMPNRPDIQNARWQQFATTVREIEGRTGLDLFSSLPKDLQDALETR